MTTNYPEIFVLRHGQTQWNAEARFQGRGNSDLTDLGRQQAAIQGAILRDTGVATRALPVFSSPQGRTQATADIVTKALGCSHQADQRLVELSQGDWEGRLMHEIATDYPEIYANRTDNILWYFNNPTAESFASLRARCKDFLHTLDGACVIVTHGITSHILRGIWLGLDLQGSADLPGGQGCVYHLVDGRMHKLEQ